VGSRFRILEISPAEASFRASWKNGGRIWNPATRGYWRQSRFVPKRPQGGGT